MTPHRAVGAPGKLVRFRAAVVLVAACGCALEPARPGPISESTPWQGTITTEGNVTTVVNETGSVWGGTAVLAEEASIGVESGSEHYMFGRVQGLAADGERIYVADRQARALRAYDWSGRYLRDFGRQGQGPGEFQSAFFVGIDPQGRVWLDDVIGARILAFSRDGDPLATIAKKPPLISGTTPTVVASDGRVFVLGLVRATESRPQYQGMIPYTIDGDTGPMVVFPTFVRPTGLTAEGNGYTRGIWPDFYPRGVRAFSSAPAIISGFPDRYRFEISHLDGESIVVERSVHLIPIAEAEADAHRSHAISELREIDPTWSWPAIGMPDVKPAFTDLVPANSGEVWVVRRGAATLVPGCNETDYRRWAAAPCWQEERIVDVFGADGRYLGDVIVPEDLVFTPRPFIDGTDVIAVAEDDAGTLRVKRYALALPPADGS